MCNIISEKRFYKEMFSTIELLEEETEENSSNIVLNKLKTEKEDKEKENKKEIDTIDFKNQEEEKNKEGEEKNIEKEEEKSKKEKNNKEEIDKENTEENENLIAEFNERSYLDKVIKNKINKMELNTNLEKSVFKKIQENNFIKNLIFVSKIFSKLKLEKKSKNILNSAFKFLGKDEENINEDLIFKFKNLNGFKWSNLMNIERGLEWSINRRKVYEYQLKKINLKYRNKEEHRNEKLLSNAIYGIKYPYLNKGYKLMFKKSNEKENEMNKLQIKEPYFFYLKKKSLRDKKIYYNIKSYLKSISLELCYRKYKNNVWLTLRNKFINLFMGSLGFITVIRDRTKKSLSDKKKKN